MPITDPQPYPCEHNKPRSQNCPCSDPGAEKGLIPQIIDLLDAKVYRVIIGTHHPDIHKALSKLFQHRGWHVILNVPHVTLPNKSRTRADDATNNRWGMLERVRMTGHDCTQVFVRGYGPRENKHNWPRMRRHRECYHETPRGPVANYDGELILDNPRFVKPSAFSLADTQLRVDDLY